MTLAEQVARANNWDNAYACGYLDGKRDKGRRLKPQIDRMDRTDYGHGYFKGYSE